MIKKVFELMGLVLVNIFLNVNGYSNNDIFDWSNFEVFLGDTVVDEEVEELHTRITHALKLNGNGSESALLRGEVTFILENPTASNMGTFLRQVYKLIKGGPNPGQEQQNKVSAALGLIYQAKKRSIEEAIQSIQETKIGNMLFSAIRTYSGGKKIKIKLGLTSQFQSVEHVSDMAVVLAVVPQDRTVSLGRGMASGQRGLDVTLFHELVHYLHFLSNEEKYRFGLTSQKRESQKDEMMRYLATFFQTENDNISLSLGCEEMKSWIQVDSFGQESFLLEEMRTIWGDPSSNCLIDYISESLYIYQRQNGRNLNQAIDDVRLGYIDDVEFKPQQLMNAINNGRPIQEWFDVKIRDTINLLAQKEWICGSERCQSQRCRSRRKTSGCCGIS